MPRSSTLLTLGVVVAITASGCAAASSSPQRLAAACNTARTQLIAIGALVEDATATQSEDDAQLKTDAARQITASADRLAGSLKEPEAASAFSSVKTALASYSGVLSDESTTADDLAAAQREVEGSGQDLMTLCAGSEASDGEATSGAKVLNFPADPAYVDDGRCHADVSPNLQVGQSLSGSMLGNRRAQKGPRETPTPIRWTMTLDEAEQSLWSPASWTYQYVLTFEASGEGEYWFTDQSGDTYSLSVLRSGGEHKLYYDSSAPEITRLSCTR